MKKTINLIAVMILVAICGAAVTAQTTQKEDDFEIVVPGQRDVKTNPAVNPTPAPKNETPVRNNAENTLPTNQAGNNKKIRNGKKGDVVAASLGATGNLPFRVEISDVQPDATITLGVGAATRFATQEKPTRLVIGNLTDIGVTKAGSSTWYGFYLRPVNGGVTTNMFIEFASGATRMINIKTVDPKVLRPGDYNSEVFVKTTAARDEMFKIKNENEGLKAKVANLEKIIKDKEAQPVEPTKVFTVEEMDKNIWSLLEKSSGLIKNKSGFPKDSAIGRFEINMMTPLWEPQTGKAYLWIELSNKEKKSVSITKIELLGAKGEIITSKNNLIVEPNKQTQLGIKITISEAAQGISQLRFTTSEGKSGDVALNGFAVVTK